MIGGPVKLAVNSYIMANPDRALEVTGALAAAGIVGVTLRQIIKVVGVKESELPEGGLAEVELLDEQAPAGFFGVAVGYAHDSLAAWKMRGGGALPRLGWHHGLWRVRHAGAWTGDPGFDAAARPLDLVDVITPAMDEEGRLV